jgi:hypothetical protein
MTSSTLRTCLVFGVCLLLALPSVAAAQALTEADSVTVSLWPEYDRSEVLVIYRVALPAATELPTQVRLLVPPDAPELTAAAYRSASGELVNAVTTRDEGEQADVIEVAAEGTDVQIEFYLPLPVSDDLRQFSFIWPGGLSTPTFAYEVQQPLGAQEVQVDPAPTGRTTDSVGLTYHVVELGAQTAEDHPEISFSYSNPTAQLTAEGLTAAGGLAEPAPAAPLSIDISQILPWLLLAGGVVLIAGGAIYYFRTRAEDRPARPRHRASRAPADTPDRVDASPVYCHNCGTQATVADRFCRQCGTALRL